MSTHAVMSTLKEFPRKFGVAFAKSRQEVKNIQPIGALASRGLRVKLHVAFSWCFDACFAEPVFHWDQVFLGFSSSP